MRALDLRLPVCGDAVQAVQIGEPDQQQRRIPDELLFPGKVCQARLALGVFDGHHAPDLQVGGGGC